MARKLLIVDDEESMLGFLEILLSREGYEVFCARDGIKAMDIIRDEPIDLVIADLKMSPMDGIELLRKIKEESSDVTVIMMTAYASIDNAIACMKEGAYDYITKPFKVDEIKIAVRKALREKSIIEENRFLRQELERRAGLDEIIGNSLRMEKVFELISRIAPPESTVLIQGESGTGKELVARAIHKKSRRSNGPFVPIDCGALPESLLETELFGHVKGAFTDAKESKKGLFEVADKGTLFLDEVGEVSPTIQVKLLRTLEEKEVRHIGATSTTKVDIRLIAATNKDLSEAVKSGKFREDLFYRLNVVPVILPPLRERNGDIPLLIDHFLKKHTGLLRKPMKRVSREAMEIFMNYSWPGNVRELGNAIERIVALKDGEVIEIDDVDEKIRLWRKEKEGFVIPLSENGVDFRKVTEETERRLILNALRECDGSHTKAAKVLNMKVRSLRYLIAKYKIDCQNL